MAMLAVVQTTVDALADATPETKATEPSEFAANIPAIAVSPLRREGTPGCDVLAGGSFAVR